MNTRGIGVTLLGASSIFVLVESWDHTHLQALKPHSHAEDQRPVEIGKFQYTTPVSGDPYLADRPIYEIVTVPDLRNLLRSPPHRPCKA